jgi:hypothetical protein
LEQVAAAWRMPMVNITHEPFNYDDESWVISSESYIPPTNLRTNDSSKDKAEPPEPEKAEPAEKE